MKKFLIILLIVLALCFISYNHTPKSISLKYVDTITIKLLSFPPKMKIVTEEKDLKEIINFFNSIDYSTTEEKHNIVPLISIAIDGDLNCSLIFVDNLVKFNGTWYEVDNNTLIELRNIYDNLQCDEIPIFLSNYNKYIKNLNFIQYKN